MGLEAVLVVGLIVLGALFALAVHVAWLRARVLRQEHTGAELSRTLATVQGWTAKELRALRGEFSVERVNASAAKIMTHRAEKRVAITPPPSREEDDPEEQRDTDTMPAPGTPTAEPSDEDATSIFDREPPLYAERFLTMRPPAPRPPLAHPDLIGCEDIADEAARAHLDPEEQTPPRRGRSAVLVPAFQVPEEKRA